MLIRPLKAPCILASTIFVTDAMIPSLLILTVTCASPLSGAVTFALTATFGAAADGAWMLDRGHTSSAEEQPA
jgi:hypothetical protein